MEAGWVFGLAISGSRGHVAVLEDDNVPSRIHDGTRHVGLTREPTGTRQPALNRDYERATSSLCRFLNIPDCPI